MGHYEIKEKGVGEGVCLHVSVQLDRIYQEYSLRVILTSLVLFLFFAENIYKQFSLK